MAKNGSLSINSENIFPIIKKWLYSDHDIFYRELVSNGCDAITKLKKLSLMGEYETPDDETYKVQVTVNPKEKTIRIEDNGLGMTEDEVDEYINQIAFSGAQDFLNKYKDKANEDQIIGHFGLGFYSAFMVADKVTIDTLSYKKDAKPVHWESEGGTEFDMKEGTKEGHGTVITLYLNEDSAEFANEYRAREILDKYCAFMPVEIYLNDETAEPQYDTIEKDELTDKDTIIETIVEPAKTEEKEKEDGTKETVEVSPAKEKYKIARRPVPVNDTNPLWNKHPNECTDEEYKEFYRKVFQDFKEPLFWIHLNMDYPFNLKGILYFPKINMEYESIEGKIKLYNNQVFIADNIKEVIPEFLMLLKGVIDCPDLPLNVSRSALQNDGFVKKISDYITKKVADKLNQLFKTDRSAFEGFWDDINIFIKYGCMKEEKLYDKVKDILLLKTTDGVYETVAEYLEKNKEKHENVIYFATDTNQQAQYIRLFKEQGLEAAIMDTPVDKPFVSFLEYKNQDIKLKVQRVDADIDSLQEKEDAKISEAKKQADEFEANQMQELFRAAVANEKLNVKLEALKAEKVSAMILLSEESRRMMEMMEAYANNEEFKAMFANMKPDETLVLNKNNKLVKALLSMAGKEEKKEDATLLCHQLYDLALMSHRPLTSEEMTAFIDRSNLLLEKLTAFEA